MKTLNGIKRQKEIMQEHKKYQGEIAIIDKFLTTILSKNSKTPLIGEFIKNYIAVNYPKWHKISEAHIYELAGFSENSDNPELYDKGKDCVFKTIGYCVNEELN